MRTGRRKFDGKVYDFYMFKDTKADAQKAVKQFIKREREQFEHKGFARITQGSDPWHPLLLPPHNKRYLIWVRITKG